MRDGYMQIEDQLKEIKRMAEWVVTKEKIEELLARLTRRQQSSNHDKSWDAAKAVQLELPNVWWDLRKPERRPRYWTDKRIEWRPKWTLPCVDWMFERGGWNDGGDHYYVGEWVFRDMLPLKRPAKQRFMAFVVKLDYKRPHAPKFKVREKDFRNKKKGETDD